VAQGRKQGVTTAAAKKTEFGSTQRRPEGGLCFRTAGCVG